MASLKVISADSHMMEPPDLWTQRLDHKFKERAPKVVTQDAGSRPLFVAPGTRALSDIGRLRGRPQRQ